MSSDTGPSARSEQVSRRAFLGIVGGAAAAIGVSGVSAAFAKPDGTSGNTAVETVPRSKLGTILYNCQAADVVDGPETLALLAQIGYEYVEASPISYGSVTESDPATGRLGMSPKAFRKSLDDNGLWCIGSQGPSPYPYDDKKWKLWVEDNLIIGSLVLGNNVGFPAKYSNCLRYAEAVHRAHDVASRMGFTGYLYTHLDAAGPLSFLTGTWWGRLTDRPNTFAYEVVLANTDRDIFNLELDCGNAYTALGSVGAVIEQVRRYPGRWPLHHMKDVAPLVYAPNGTWVPQGGPAVTPEFGAGVFGLPDPSAPMNRPHAGFQDLLTAIRETQDWPNVWLITESNGSQASCADYAYLSYRGLNGLHFPYRRRR
jgi:sugar phosphate isomerase/epimerase